MYDRSSSKKLNKTKEQYSKEIQAQKDQLQKEIEDIAQNYTHSPEQLAELAAFQARFYSYSFRNTMLIYLQNPGASFVGSFQKLKEIGQSIALENNILDEKGRPPYFGVRSGEKAMKVFVPVHTTLIRIDKANDEWVQLSKATAAQKAAAEKGALETKTRLSFKLGSVFDISQTLIPPEYYPQIYDMGYSSEQHAQVFEGLKAYIENELGCPVEVNIDNSISLRGLCYTVSERIELNSKLEDTQRLSTLSHEFGHFLMHRSEARAEKSTAQIEIEADIYSIMLCAHFGIAPTDVRKGHLADSYRAYQEIVEQSDNKNELDPLETIFGNANKAFNESIQEIDKYVQAFTQGSQFIAEECDVELEV